MDAARQPGTFAEIFCTQRMQFENRFDMKNSSLTHAGKSRIKVVSLFSGAGGMDIGFSGHGFEIILALDNNPIAVETYSVNRDKRVAQFRDLSKLSGKQ